MNSDKLIRFFKTSIAFIFKWVFFGWLWIGIIKLLMNQVDKTIDFFTNSISVSKKKQVETDPLKFWGVSETQLPIVVRNLRIEALAYAFLIIFAAATLAYTASHWQMFYYAMVTPVCLFGYSVRAWQAECLEKRKLLKFWPWLIKGREISNG